MRASRPLARRLRLASRAAAALRDDRGSALVVGEQPAVAGVGDRDVRLRPEPVVLEDRRLAALEVRVDLVPLRILLVPGPDADERRAALDRIAVRHLAVPAGRYVDGVAEALVVEARLRRRDAEPVAVLGPQAIEQLLGQLLRRLVARLRRVERERARGGRRDARVI